MSATRQIGQIRSDLGHQATYTYKQTGSENSIIYAKSRKCVVFARTTMISALILNVNIENFFTIFAHTTLFSRNSGFLTRMKATNPARCLLNLLILLMLLHPTSVQLNAISLQGSISFQAFGIIAFRSL